jgi:hypothetical protein
MHKIPTLFKRDYDGTRLVYDELVEGTEWVVAGEGIATLKVDGTACLVKGGILYKRYDAKRGRTPPDGFVPAQQEPDEVTGHWPGWFRVGDGPEDRWHREAWHNTEERLRGFDWTYELLGPKVQGNPYRLTKHHLERHGASVFIPDVPRTFHDLRLWLANHPSVEGIVWWRDLVDVDCDKVKLKRRDYGLSWPDKQWEAA